MEKWNIQGKLIIHKKRKINIFQMVLVEFKKKKKFFNKCTKHFEALVSVEGEHDLYCKLNVCAVHNGRRSST